MWFDSGPRFSMEDEKFQIFSNSFKFDDEGFFKDLKGVN